MTVEVIRNLLLAAALEYAGYGWHVVPLHNPTDCGGCSCGRATCPTGSRGKHPRLKEWQDKCSADEEVIDGWWAKWPDANVGVQLGPKSGIIDVEFDTAEGVATAARMLGECFTPSFRSGRSTHRLFRWSEDLSGLQNTVKRYGLEFRLGVSGGTQSVFPPSRHHSGAVYAWLDGLRPGQVEVLDMPDALRALLWNDDEGTALAAPASNGRPKSVRSKLIEQPQVSEGERDNVMYAEACGLWRERYMAFGAKVFESPDHQTVVYERLLAWNGVKCSPPLDAETIRQKFDGARKFIAGEITKETVDGILPGPKLTALGLEWRGGEWWPGVWKVETIDSEPPMVRLHAPFLPKKFIDLSVVQYDSPNDVHRAVFAATGNVCLSDKPGFWPSLWNGFRDEDKVSHVGLKAKLLWASAWIPAPAEIDRRRIAAELLLAQLHRARLLDDGKAPDRGGHPARLQDGTIVCKFGYVLDPMHQGFDKITRSELSKLMRELGVEDKVIRASDGTAQRYKLFDAKHITSLERMQ